MLALFSRVMVHNFLHSSVLLTFFVSPKLHLLSGNLNTIIMFCGLEIKRLSQLLKNKQKQDGGVHFPSHTS